MKHPKQMAFDSISTNEARSEILKSKSKQEMIEIGGRLSQVLGFPRSTGQIYGLLYFSSVPLSLGDICIKLGISKASTSTGTRQLATWGAIRKVWIPGERKDYYEAIDDLMHIFKGSYRAIIKPRVNSSESRIKKIEESLDKDLKMLLVTKTDYEFMNERLTKLKKIHRKITKAIPILEKLF